MRISPTFALAAALLPSCASGQSQTAPAHPDWRLAATESDRARLRQWRDAFVEGLAAARRSNAAEVAREGPLLIPDAALADAAIPNGLYRCRIIKLGAKTQGMLDYVAYPAFTCRVSPAGNVQSFVKVTGSQRHVGRIYPFDRMRRVFLGTMVLGDERGALRYGQDEDRDIAGFIERVGPYRWRLIMPRPHFESQIDVMELVPLREGAR